MKKAQLFYIPSNGSHMYHGYYAVAEEAEEALKVFKECWTEVVDDVDKNRNIALKDLIVVDQKIMLPYSKEKKPRILNTYVGLVDIKMIKYFDKPAFFGWAWKVGPNETPEIMLSPKAWCVYQYDYDARGWIAFQADDLESGVKVLVDGRMVVWMYTYETDTIYNEAYKESTEEAIGFALSIVRDAKILRKKYEEML